MQKLLLLSKFHIIVLVAPSLRSELKYPQLGAHQQSASELRAVRMRSAKQPNRSSAMSMRRVAASQQLETSQNILKQSSNLQRTKEHKSGGKVRSSSIGT